jgi:hypothetical protein
MKQNYEKRFYYNTIKKIQKTYLEKKSMEIRFGLFLLTMPYYFVLLLV